jgi:hypothetical protein
MILVEILVAELRHRREAREVVDLKTPMRQGEQLPLPQYDPPPYYIAMHAVLRICRRSVQRYLARREERHGR